MEECRVYLRTVATSQLVEASLPDEVIDKHLAMWNASWQAAMQSDCAGRTLRDMPEGPPLELETEGGKPKVALINVRNTYTHF